MGLHKIDSKLKNAEVLRLDDVCCRVLNHDSDYLVGVFYQLNPGQKANYFFLQTLHTSMSTITTTWNRAIKIAGDVYQNISCT